MLRPKHTRKIEHFSKTVLTSLIIISTYFGFTEFAKKPIPANAGVDFMWDSDPNYVKLRYLQTSRKKNERSTYFLFLRSRERKTGILKLTINIPDYFDANIKAKKLSLCKAKIGGFNSKSKCIEEIPAVIEVNKDQTRIEIFPDNPIPVDNSTYALRMKIFNPRKPMMFQFHAYAQSPGALPISSYVGSWNMNVE